jgi:RAB protein geranylgeranyltransferase component A
MNRKEVYEVIKEMNLQELVKNIYGKNYTNVPTDALLQVITNATKMQAQSVIDEEWEIEMEPCNLDAKINMLVDILFKKRLLLTSEVKAIKEA